MIKSLQTLIKIGLFCLICLSAEAQYTQDVIITSPIPPAKEVIITPSGYLNCFTVAAGYYNNVWVAERQVCQYDMPGRAAWIGGYWQCTEFNRDNGVCTTWDWVSGHWSDVLTTY